MSFLQKAREAAEQMATQARQAVEPPASNVAEASTAAAPDAPPATPAAPVAPAELEPDRDGLVVAGPGMGFDTEGARAQLAGAFGFAKKGLAGVIDKIDAGTMADVIIKATALQEKTNQALRLKGSLYRISEISISASIPPSVSFAISRNDDPEGPAGELTSTELLADAAASTS